MIITVPKKIINENGETTVMPDTEYQSWRILEERENEFVIEILD
ncbi:hypothetical protein [Metabacillus halosaccharovorans]|nr:hypothetical protein [Metabacillus halosaccharovorans]